MPDHTHRCPGCEHRITGSYAAAQWYAGKQQEAREWLLDASAKDTANVIEELTIKGFATQAFNITHQLIKGARL